MMASTTRGRATTEIVIAVVGLAGIAAAAKFSVNWLFIGSIFVCVFAGGAVLLYPVMSKFGRPLQIYTAVLACAVTAWSLWYMYAYRNENEIFSPALVGYLTGGIFLSAVVNLFRRRRVN